MKAFISELKSKVSGEVYDDELSLRVYSVDASICEVQPQAVLVPRTPEDIHEAIKLAHEHQIPITPRGAATGIAGGCLGYGLVIDCSKYLRSILEIDLNEGYAVCQPGVVQNELNAALSRYGFRLGPDTSTGDRATIGGMLANNSCGAHSLKYGKMVDHVLEVKGYLSDGTYQHFHEMTNHEWQNKMKCASREGHLYREIDHIRQEYGQDILKHFPSIPRRVSGYNLDELMKPGPLNVSKLIAGSEGTLMLTTEVRVAIVSKPSLTALCLIFFENLLEAFQFAPDFLQFHPIAMELIDEKIIRAGYSSPALKGKLNWLKIIPKALLMIEIEACSKEQLQSNLEDVSQFVGNLKIDCQHSIVIDSETINQVWILRKAGLGLLLSKRSYSRAVAFLEDIALPPENLKPFMEEFCQYLKTLHKEAGIYGHIGAGCMHIRPYINLRDQQDSLLLKTMMDEVSDLLLKYNGAMSGEHGDGLIRSWLNKKMFGERVMQAFERLKYAFDPAQLMNPGKLVFAQMPFNELRSSPDSKIESIPTFLDFTREGGFELAADLCNGNGLCRKKEGIMCPSFQVDNDEFHSTRARAQALRGVINGQLPRKNLVGMDLMEILDLCIGCKGCKSECPSQVDMAKMKAEVLFHNHEKYGSSIRDKLFGYIGGLQKILSNTPKFANFLHKSSGFKWIMRKIGISSDRELPLLAKEKFSKWFEDYHQPDFPKQVLLFNDTFNEFNHPEIGISAVKLLNQLGFEVISIPWMCCGRTLFSKGFLKPAKKYSQSLVSRLLPYAKQDIPIIGLEPSCLFMIRDDYYGLIPSKDLDLVASKCQTLDEFLLSLIQTNRWIPKKSTTSLAVKNHTHCHQKSLIGSQTISDLLKSIPGFQVEEIDAGCCGMAGSFGYESEHVDFSMRIGELKLLPAVRNCALDTVIVANGTSCRQQIIDGSSKRAYHLAEVLANHLIKNEHQG